MKTKEPNLSYVTARTIRTMQSPDFLRLMGKVAVMCLIGFALWMIAAIWGARYMVSALELLGEDNWFISMIVGWVAGWAASFIAWFLLPILVPIIAMFFQERIANRIERADYPSCPQPTSPTHWGRDLWEDIKFVLILLLLNIIALPLYFLPIVNLFIYYVLNGYLLSREFFETAAARHIIRMEARTLRRQHRWLVWGIGIMVVLMTNVPLLNILSPFFAVAMMVHLFHASVPEEQLHAPHQQVLPPEESA